MPVALAPGMGLNAYFAYQVIHISDLCLIHTADLSVPMSIP